MYVDTYLQLYLVALKDKKGTEGEKVLKYGRIPNMFKKSLCLQ